MPLLNAPWRRPSREVESLDTWWRGFFQTFSGVRERRDAFLPTDIGPPGREKVSHPPGAETE